MVWPRCLSYKIACLLLGYSVAEGAVIPWGVVAVIGAEGWEGPPVGCSVHFHFLVLAMIGSC